MKKSTVIALTILLATACHPRQEGSIVFDTASADKEVKLSNEENSPVCAVHLKLAYATDDNGEKAEIINNAIQEQLLDMRELTMQQAVDSFASSYTRSYIRNFRPLYNKDKADTTKRSWYDYHYILSSEVQQGSKETMTYIATIDYYEGGAHSINQQKIMNFNAKTGQIVGLGDIFVKGYESQLNSFLLRALCEKVGAKDIKNLHEMGYLFSMEIFPANNFILGDETITFIYNPYEIASYDKGTTELTLSLSDLGHILKQVPKP